MIRVDLANFKKDLDKASDKALDKVGSEMVKVAANTYNKLVANTRIRTGRMASSWRVGINRAYNQPTLSAVAPYPSKKGRDRQVYFPRKMRAINFDPRKNKKIVISNVVEYTKYWTDEDEINIPGVIRAADRSLKQRLGRIKI